MPLPQPLGSLAGLGALVIDDNDTSLQILSGILRAQGMLVLTAHDDTEARRALDEAPHGFALLLVDLFLADSRGTDLAAALRQDPRCATAAIIVLTSSDRTEIVGHSASLADARHMVKPVGEYALVKAVHEALGSRTSADAQPAAPGRLPQAAARRLRVLVAEDNIVNQKLAAHLLLRRGHDAVIVENGRQAIEALAASTFDLVLMDLQMPEMDGLEATAAIRERERQTGGRLAIIALTAHAMKGDRQRCLEADMDGYVAKPVNAVELFEVIDRVMADASALRT